LDIRLFFQALARHKWIALGGLGLAVVFAVLSVARVSPLGEGPTFSYRKDVVWGSRVVLQITQPGFFEGRVTDEGRRASLLELTPLYAALVNSDPVLRRMRRNGPIFGAVSVKPLVDENGAGLPLIEVAGFAKQAKLAARRALAQSNAFIAYLSARQIANGVPERQRVSLDIIKGPTRPVPAQPRKMTLAVVVFMSMLVLTAALVLVVDNLGRRRRTHALEPVEPVDSTPPEVPRVIVRADETPHEREDVAASAASGSARPERSRWSGRR
jgi:hypothetical protein